MLDLQREGAITTDHLVRNRRPLDQVNDALDDLRAGRVVRSVIGFGSGW